MTENICSTCGAVLLELEAECPECGKYNISCLFCGKKGKGVKAKAVTNKKRFSNARDSGGRVMTGACKDCFEEYNTLGEEW